MGHQHFLSDMVLGGFVEQGTPTQSGSLASGAAVGMHPWCHCVPVLIPGGRLSWDTQRWSCAGGGPDTSLCTRPT